MLKAGLGRFQDPRDPIKALMSYGVRSGVTMRPGKMVAGSQLAVNGGGGFDHQTLDVFAAKNIKNSWKPAEISKFPPMTEWRIWICWNA